MRGGGESQNGMVRLIDPRRLGHPTSTLAPRWWQGCWQQTATMAGVCNGGKSKCSTRADNNQPKSGSNNSGNGGGGGGNGVSHGSGNGSGNSGNGGGNVAAMAVVMALPIGANKTVFC